MKALAMLSGGLDSILAVKLVQEQGIEVIGVHFSTPFLTSEADRAKIGNIGDILGIKVRYVSLGKDYIKIIRNPRHGYGKNMNPCIDCRVFMLRKAKALARKLDAKFIITGEVLDERPMSQKRRALELIDKESGLEGKILRPLSAKLLPETEAEKKGWIDREKLLDIKGRVRKKQISLAGEFGIRDYPTPSGGCLLTDRAFSNKLRDLLTHKNNISRNGIIMLKVGRHFRFGKNKITVGRNEGENDILIKIKGRDDYVFEAQGVGSPITLLQGRKAREAVRKAAELTARYSDSGSRGVEVRYGIKKPAKKITVKQMNKKEIDKLRI